jgi:hypothetical protein
MVVLVIRAENEILLSLRGTNMSNNWITIAESVKIISKNSYHSVSPYHIQTLVNRGKIGTRSSDEGTQLLKLSDVEATRVAVGTGNVHHKDRARTEKLI